MTATAEITTLTRENVLLAPNAALRFEPGNGQKASKPSVLSSILPRRSQPKKNKQAIKNLAQGNVQNIWILNKGAPEAIQVTIGATDGRFTEIVKGELKEGMKVIVGSTGGKK